MGHERRPPSGMTLPRLTEAYRHSIELGGPRDVETRSRGADGVYRWFHLRSRPQLDAKVALSVGTLWPRISTSVSALS